MRRVVCPRCSACFGEDDGTWQRACLERRCPYCSRALDINDEAIQFDPYRGRGDPTPLLLFFTAAGLAFILGTAWLLLDLLSWPVPTLWLAVLVLLYATRRMRAAYRLYAVISLIGVFGVVLSWFTWSVAALCLVSVATLHLGLRWLERPWVYHCRSSAFLEDFIRDLLSEQNPAPCMEVHLRDRHLFTLRRERRSPGFFDLTLEPGEHALESVAIGPTSLANLNRAGDLAANKPLTIRYSGPWDEAVVRQTIRDFELRGGTLFGKIARKAPRGLARSGRDNSSHS
jgi:hypothetical protein